MLPWIIANRTGCRMWNGVASDDAACERLACTAKLFVRPSRAGDALAEDGATGAPAGSVLSRCPHPLAATHTSTSIGIHRVMVPPSPSLQSVHALPVQANHTA